MTKCENCYHKKVCINSANFRNAENCRQYKNESRIVELPCRVGDVIYCHKLLMDGKYTVVVEEDTVKRVIITPVETLVIKSFGHALSCDDFGKTVFLSREEAEMALELKEKP